MFPRAFQNTMNSLALAAVATIAGWMVSGEAHAQPRIIGGNQVVFPPGLKWEMMRPAQINFEPAVPGTPYNKGSTKDAQQSEMLWSDIIAPALKVDRTRSFFFNNYDATDANNREIYFSLLSFFGDYDKCSPALDGKDAVDIYEKCLLRIRVTGDKLTRPVTYEFKDVCTLHVVFEDQNTQIRNNQTQIAFDRQRNAAYIRVIQNGKTVPACNRAIRL